MLEVGDLDKLVMAVAPRAFLLTAGETDPLFPIDGVRSLVERARHRYAWWACLNGSKPSFSRLGIAFLMK